jgi:hypothetical protein
MIKLGGSWTFLLATYSMGWAREPGGTRFGRFTGGGKS